MVALVFGDLPAVSMEQFKDACNIFPVLQKVLKYVQEDGHTMQSALTQMYFHTFTFRMNWLAMMVPQFVALTV